MTPPLAGRLIAITRAREQASELAGRLEALGAKVLAVPTISFADPDDWGPLDAALRRCETFDWILFTSVNAVERTRARAALVAPDAFEKVARAREGGAASGAQRISRAGEGGPPGPRIAAIGPATARALVESGLQPDVVPTIHRGEDFAAALPLAEMCGRTVLLPRALVAREDLPGILRAAGAHLTVAPCYRTLLPDLDADALARRLASGAIDAITFTSSSTVSHFAALFPEGRAAALLGQTRPVCIGPVTASTLRELGVEPAAVAEPATIPSLVDALVALFR